MLKFYNTLTRRKEQFVPIDSPNVNMYACGITVSGNAHIGHLYQAMIYDIIRKVLEKNGYKVKYARNYTDIDDKIIASANKLGVDSKLYAQNMIDKIDEEMRYFQVDDPNVWLKATENIDNIIAFVQTLIDKGFAYPTKNGDVYFSVSKFPKYGCLSNRNLQDAQNGYRIDNDEEKESPLDFALWKSAKPNEPYWISPWGKGRPGWHIECSTMNKSAFGEQIDIHGGGRDLIFPHHENEIAQSEAYSGKQFVKYWIHNGLIKVNGQKMSKSLGNSIILEDLKKQYHPEVVKFALLQNSYRSDLNITDEVFAQAEKHIYNFHKVLKEVENNFNVNAKVVNTEIEKTVMDALNDDFNTSKALSYIFEIIKKMQKKIVGKDDSVVADYNGLKNAYKILGLFINDSQSVLDFIDAKQTNNVPSEIKELAEKRWQAKLAKDWATADAVRGELDEKGYIVKDNKDGYEILKK
ncbi:MAG: cysteine--tRNA ligase [Clostridia bacterium]|nr:cysteine--tRNA ligase [Clostridia bacterium]